MIGCPPDSGLGRSLNTAFKGTNMSEIEETAKKMEELRAGRNESDIPLSDDYWKAVAAHRDAFQKSLEKSK